jgi:hypothetical protein
VGGEDEEDGDDEEAAGSSPTQAYANWMHNQTCLVHPPTTASPPASPALDGRNAANGEESNDDNTDDSAIDGRLGTVTALLVLYCVVTSAVAWCESTPVRLHPPPVVASDTPQQSVHTTHRHPRLYSDGARRFKPRGNAAGAASLLAAASRRRDLVTGQSPSVAVSSTPRRAFANSGCPWKNLSAATGATAVDASWFATGVRGRWWKNTTSTACAVSNAAQLHNYNTTHHCHSRVANVLNRFNESLPIRSFDWHSMWAPLRAHRVRTTSLSFWRNATTVTAPLHNVTGAPFRPSLCDDVSLAQFSNATVIAQLHDVVGTSRGLFLSDDVGPSPWLNTTMVFPLHDVAVRSRRADRFAVAVGSRVAAARLDGAILKRYRNMYQLPVLVNGRFFATSLESAFSAHHANKHARVLYRRAASNSSVNKLTRVLYRRAHCNGTVEWRWANSTMPLAAPSTNKASSATTTTFNVTISTTTTTTTTVATAAVTTTTHQARALRKQGHQSLRQGTANTADNMPLRGATNTTRQQHRWFGMGLQAGVALDNQRTTNVVPETDSAMHMRTSGMSQLRAINTDQAVQRLAHENRSADEHKGCRWTPGLLSWPSPNKNTNNSSNGSVNSLIVAPLTSVGHYLSPWFTCPWHHAPPATTITTVEPTQEPQQLVDTGFLGLSFEPWDTFAGVGALVKTKSTALSLRE